VSHDSGALFIACAAVRVSVSSWNTTEEDIDRSVAAVLACAARGN
jgi:hypothetical protein